MGEHSGILRVNLAVCCTLLAAALAGCGGPDYYPVTGKVTLDSQPLPNASITFMSESEDATAAFGWTDEEGNYQLECGLDELGTPAGTYRVHITTYQEGNDQDDPPIPPVPEKVPAEYNIQSKLTAEVKPEENVLNFELSSQGEIIQPDRAK